MTENARRPVTKVVILARGLGTRMRKADPRAQVAPEQAAAADSGVKAMIPVGRPFLDFLLSATADAGFTRACLVIGEEHSFIRSHYGEAHPPTRIEVSFALQVKPLGTADAVLAAESFVGTDDFVVLNSDNYYPVSALAALRVAPPPALVAFERDALVQGGNVPPGRVERFGALEIDGRGMLERILARPDASRGAGEEVVYASMNCWLFTPGIFRACREVPYSVRGELELPQAVQLAIDRHGAEFTALRVATPVLDLSSRADIASVTERMRDVRVLL